jgi:uncharacterized protein
MARVLLGALPSLEPDCACPTPPIPPPAAGRGAALDYQRPERLHTERLTADWTLACNPLAGGAPAVLNAAALQRLAVFEQPRRLSDAADDLLAAASLIVPAGAAQGAPGGRPDLLTAWIHVTNACNLDCPYCYVRKSAARMTLEDGQRAIDALVATAQANGFTTIKVKYAGGEAALHYRLVVQLHEYARQRTAQHGLGLRAVVLSNGTVMPAAFAEWLAGSGVRLMLSVDGVGAEHDIQRPFVGGRDGAFARLERNLRDQLLPRGIRPDICITVTGRTAASAQSAVAWAIGYDLPFSLNFYREHEQSARFQDLRYEEAQIIAGLRAAYATVERLLPERPFLDGLLDRVQAQAHGHTCGVGQNYVVISHTGQVAQCQMALEQAAPFAADSDLIPLVAAGAIHNVHVDEKAGCRDCQWRYRCAGGCPIVTLRATGRVDIKSPNCGIYQALYPAALRLEGLRILKAAGH